jgi:hypothetical protein
MIGDVVFFKKDTSFISRIIAKMTKSEYSHVGLVVAYDELTKEATIIESDRFVNTRINRIILDDKKYVVYTTGDKSKEQEDKILKYAYRHLGVKYDYFQILGLFISLLFKGEVNRYFNSANKLICSELIDLAYYTSGVKRDNSIKLGDVTPQELLEVYEFKVRKGV